MISKMTFEHIIQLIIAQNFLYLEQILNKGFSALEAPVGSQGTPKKSSLSFLKGGPIFGGHLSPGGPSLAPN